MQYVEEDAMPGHHPGHTTLWELVTALQDEADAITSTPEEADALVCHAILDFLETEAAAEEPAPEFEELPHAA